MTKTKAKQNKGAQICLLSAFSFLSIGKKRFCLSQRPLFSSKFLGALPNLVVASYGCTIMCDCSCFLYLIWPPVRYLKLRTIAHPELVATPRNRRNSTIFRRSSDVIRISEPNQLKHLFRAKSFHDWWQAINFRSLRKKERRIILLR